METIRTKGFTAKDIFNSTASTPIKDVKEETIKVADIFVKDKVDGDTVGYLKTEDGTIYATVSNTVIDQLPALAEINEGQNGAVEVKVVPKTSNSGREYYILELV